MKKFWVMPSFSVFFSSSMSKNWPLGKYVVKFKKATHNGFCCSGVYDPKVLENRKTVVGGEAGSTCPSHTLVPNHYANCVCVSGIECAFGATKRIKSRGSNLSTFHHISQLLSQQTFSKPHMPCTIALPTHWTIP